MTRIGIVSDTHGFLDDKIFHHFKDCDELWHAGDLGNIELAQKLAAFKPLKGVYGNIDGQLVRNDYPEYLVFVCEDVKVLMTHIGGYPPKYNKRSKVLLDLHKPKLMVTGHSHILKIMFDPQRQCLHINPGAAGKQGWQRVRTLVLLTIDGSNMKDCKVIELGATNA